MILLPIIDKIVKPAYTKRGVSPMKRNFAGISPNKNGGWDVHYQYHYPKLRIGIKSKPGKYFMMKQEDNGECSIQYYDKRLRIGVQKYDYAGVLKELFPGFNGNEIDAHKFIDENHEKLNCLIGSDIFHYCEEHNKELKKYDIIEINSVMLYCELSDTNDLKLCATKYCELAGYTVDDLAAAIEEYLQTIEYLKPNVEINPTARERSIIRHYPGSSNT
jgi:hypothetical protein